MKATVEALMEISAYAAALTGAVLLFRAVFQKQISAGFRYCLWFMVIARLLLPVTVESAFHVANLLPQSAGQTAYVRSDGIDSARNGADATPQNEWKPENAAQDSAESARPIQPKPEASRKPVDWYRACFHLWAAGMGAFFLWMAVVKLRFFRRMRALRLVVPPEVSALYAACAKAVGCKRRMPLWVVDRAMSPGVAWFGGPVLLLPGALVGDRQALAYALLHELAHYKRGDPVMCLVMNLLRGVYWFNPAVHIAFTFLQSDMETACDAAVIKKLDPSKKKGYLTAVLNQFSFETQPQLCMARYTTRRMAERRMKGAFMKKSTSPCAKIAAVCLVAFMTFACFTTACQKAPAGGITVEPSFGSQQSVGSAAPVATGQTPPLWPAVSASPAEGEPGRRSSYAVECRYSSNEAAAQVNIERAAALINADGGIAVQPGEEWSFLAAFGPLSQSDGWMLAPGVIDGKYVNNVGCAGIDQVATALYCALLTGGIEVTEHSCHAWPQAYVEKGLDATISTGVADLKFRNNTGAALTLACQTNNTEDGRIGITVELWGESLPDGLRYTLESLVTGSAPIPETEYIDDPDMPQGVEAVLHPGREGYMVEVYRRAQGGESGGTAQLLDTQTYKAMPERIARGTKQPYLLSDMPKAELAAFAKLLQSYRFNSHEHNLDEITSHYWDFLRTLQVNCGGLLSGDGGLSLTIGVPIEPFSANKCWPYAAVIFALDPAVDYMSIGGLDYRGDGDGGMELNREDVEAYYSDVLDKPLAEYAQSEKLLAQMLTATAKR